jgi:hypothetical protein
MFTEVCIKLTARLDSTPFETRGLANSKIGYPWRLGKAWKVTPLLSDLLYPQGAGFIPWSLVAHLLEFSRATRDYSVESSRSYK